MTVFEAKNLAKHFGSIKALDDVSVSVKSGEILSIVGDNGAGKSTLIKLLSGVHQKDAGEITLDGLEQDWQYADDALSAGVETLYQDAALAPDLSVAANFFFGRELEKKGILKPFRILDSRAMNKQTRKAFAEIGTEVPDPNRLIRTLSGGQRQAIAIARSVAWARKVLLLDEPTNHLGAYQKLQVLDVIRRARDRGIAIILISHALSEVLDVSDRIMVLRLGTVVDERPAGDFSSDSLVKAITGLS